MRSPWEDHRKLPGTSQSDIWLKLGALLCVAFVIIALLQMHRAPAIGYELSIYTATPTSVWFLLLLALLGGLGIVIHELATGRHQETRTCLVGFAVVLLAVTAFLCLPVIRDYFSWRGDQLAHIGFVKDIASENRLPGYNPYPVTHTLLYELSTILNCSIDKAVNLNTPLIFVVFVLGTYLLTTVVLPGRGHQITATLFATATVAALSRYNLVPNTWSILLLPVFFYCYFRRDEPPFKILLVVLILIYPFLHPLSALMIIASMAAIEFLKPAYSRLLRRIGMEPPHWVSVGPVVWPLAMQLLVFLPWVFTRSAFRSNVDALWWQLINFSGSSQGSHAMASLSKVDLDALGVFLIIVKLYGQIFLAGVFACIGIILLWRHLRRGGRGDSAGGSVWDLEPAGDLETGEPAGGDDNRIRLGYVALLFLLSTLAYFAFYAGAPGAESLSATRIVVYVEVAAIPLVGFALWEIASRASARWLAWGFVSAVIIAAAILNVLGHYTAPYQLRPNDQVTHSDIDCMEWLLHEKDPATFTFFIMSSPDRFSQAILGATVTSTRTDVKDVQWLQFADHFGYVPSKTSDSTESYNTVGEQFRMDIYGNIHMYDKAAYQTVWKSLDRVNDADFQRLEQDPTVNRIYSDGASDAYHITGHRQDTGA